MALRTTLSSQPTLWPFISHRDIRRKHREKRLEQIIRNKAYKTSGTNNSVRQVHLVR